MSDTQQESMKTNPTDNISQTKRMVNNGQNDSVNSMLLNKNVDESSQESDTNTRNRYERII